MNVKNGYVFNRLLGIDCTIRLKDGEASPQSKTEFTTSPVQNEMKFPKPFNAPRPLGDSNRVAQINYNRFEEEKEDYAKGDISLSAPVQKKLPSKCFKPVSLASTPQRVVQDEKQETEELFYKCFWSKDVRKKHKVLDDGIIVFIGNKVQVYNSEGAKIYDSFKSKQYCPNPDNRDQFIIGALFIEQDQLIKKEDFLSGRCFVKAKMTYDKDQLAQKKKMSGPLKMNKNPDQIRPCDIEVPAKSYLITARNHPDLFPVFIDSYLCEYMRPHQKQGVKFMFECITGMRGADISGCILADSMGLGKTLQTIALIWVLLRRSPFSATNILIKKVIVVAPVSLLGSWRKEVKKWLGDARLVPRIAIGNKDAVAQICRDFAMSSQKMLLISYEQFRIHLDTFEDKCDLLIFDEGHRLKNMNIKTFRSFNQIRCNRRIILTGTPLQNSLDEFYSCVKFVNPNVFESEKQFKFVFSEPILDAMKTDASADIIQRAKERSKELTTIISRFVLRRKADILEKILPPRSEYYVMLKLTPIQISLYKIMIAARFHKKEYESDTGAFSLLTVMRKLLNHPQLIFNDQNNASSQEFRQHFPDSFELNDWGCSTKFQFVSDILDRMLLIERISGQPERIIIVSYWTQTLDLLETLTREKGIKFVRLDGSVNAQKRQELIDRFQEPTTDLRVFLLCGKAGGTGLNLSAANRMILMEADWNPSNDLQVMGRIWRDGQKRPVHIYRLIACGTMEEKVLQRQFLKEELSQNVVDEKSLMAKSYNNDKMRQLFEYKDDQKCFCFKEEENQIGELKSFTPDFVDSMVDYITFVKRNMKGGEGQNNSSNDKSNNPKLQDDDDDQAPENEFGTENVFLKSEASNTLEEAAAGEELEDDEAKMGQEELEKLRQEIEMENRNGDRAEVQEAEFASASESEESKHGEVDDYSGRIGIPSAIKKFKTE